MQNIIQKYYSGHIRDDELLEAIEESVIEWHGQASNDTELHVFLGMCLPEYILWMKRPNEFVALMHHQSYYPMFWDLMD